MDSQPGSSGIKADSLEKPRTRRNINSAVSSRNMVSQPEPNRIIDGGPERPKKKRKAKNGDDAGSQSSSLNINDLPEEMLIMIFSYLSIEDRLKAEKVCNKWYHLTRSKVLWRYVKLSDISESFFIEILESLPPCVSHLEFDSEKDILLLPISLPELLAQLRRKCPSLNTLILRNMMLVKVKSDVNYVVFTLPFEFENHSYDDAKNKLDETASVIFESKFPKEEAIELQDTVMPELKVLSLKKVMFNVAHFYSHISAGVLPNLTVLDLSCTQSPTSESVCNFYLPFPCIEELCLGEWWIAAEDIFLKYLKRLRVLDLEFSTLSYKAVSALKQNCMRLEKLYLCRTNIDDICRTGKTSEYFPCLQSLCVKGTNVSRKSIEELLTACPSLKFINVSCCKNITKSWYEELRKDFKEKLLLESNKLSPCNHFVKKFSVNGSR